MACSAHDAHGLNPAQHEAVEYRGGPLLILAGAGSGKTRVVTHRIARLIEDGAAPASILALTFTNKAADEMRERAAALAGAAARDVRVSTFHSACARILRRHPWVAGLSARFSIYGDEEQLALLRDTAEGLGMPHDIPAVREDRARVEAAKNRALRPHDVRTEARGPDDERFAELFTAYQSALRDANACDFGDLIAHVVHGMQDNASFRTTLRGSVEHLIVDEFQDTNRAQYDLVRLLAPDSGDVVVVGDDDQAIYGWRGATVENVLRFRDDFTGCRVVALEQNYRSGPTILDAAHAIVAPLPERMDKRLFTSRTDHEPVRVFVGGTDEEEADYVAREILRLRDAASHELADVAVFVRTNAQSRTIEQRFRNCGIAHNVRGGIAFFERREVRDVLAYLRLALNPCDTAAFARIANAPKRGLGAASLRRIRELHDVSGATSYRESLEAATGGAVKLSSAARAGAKKLAEVLAVLESVALRGSAGETVEAIVAELDLTTHLRDSDPILGEERAQNVEALVEMARQFRTPDGIAGSALDFAESLTLSSLDDGSEESTSRVQIMTVHSAKGLEFPVVFVTGMEQGVFPLERRGEVESPDEERRLCYVGFTRAQYRLYVTAAMRRTMYGKSMPREPSEFLLELPEAVLEIVPESASRELDWRGRASTRAQTGAPTFDEFDQRTWQERHATVPESGLVFDDIPREAVPAADDLRGRSVRHNTFGDGRVVASADEGGKRFLTIEFAGAGTKRVARKFVDLLD